VAEHNSGTNRLDFGGYTDLYPDPGGRKWEFLNEFAIALLSMVKTVHREFSNSRKIRSLADLRLNNAALESVCALQLLPF